MKKISGLLVAIISIMIIVGGYYGFAQSQNKKNIENQTEVTEVEKVLGKDLTTSYPLTPREVLKYYNRVLGCLYNEEYTEAQFQELAQRMFTLMDSELAQQNPIDDYKVSLLADVTDFRAKEKKLNVVTVSDSADVQYKKVDGRECAYVTVDYFIQQGDLDFFQTSQLFVLRKDEQENWKILAFTLLDREESDE